MAARIFTLPNELTFLRLGFLPFFLIFIFYDHYAWALGMLIAAAVTDGLDGMLARQLNQKTALGAYLDPIADKLLLSSSFIVLALKKKIFWWLTILVLSRDVIILTTAAVILLAVGYRPFPPSVYGKVTTAVQILLVFVVICAEVVHSSFFDLLRWIFIYLVAGFTVLSGFHYSVIITRRLSSA